MIAVVFNYQNFSTYSVYVHAFVCVCVCVCVFCLEFCGSGMSLASLEEL